MSGVSLDRSIIGDSGGEDSGQVQRLDILDGTAQFLKLTAFRQAVDLTVLLFGCVHGLTGSAQNVVQHVAVNVGQTEVSARIPIR